MSRFMSGSYDALQLACHNVTVIGEHGLSIIKQFVSLFCAVGDSALTVVLRWWWFWLAMMTLALETLNLDQEHRRLSLFSSDETDMTAIL